MEKANYILSSVDHALQVMDLLNETPEIGVAEIARALGIGKSSAFRLLTTLESREYIKKDAHSKYRLGFKFVQYSANIMNRFDIAREARPYIEQLCASLNETAHIVVWKDEKSVVFIDKAVSSATIRMDSYVGKTMPAYATGTGKVLLAYQPEPDIQRYLDAVEFFPFTKNTCRTKKALFEELCDIRIQGYGVDAEEYELGLTCVAAPIFGIEGKAIAAVSVSGPNTRVRANKERVVAEVKRIAAEISGAI